MRRTSVIWNRPVWIFSHNVNLVPAPNLSSQPMVVGWCQLKSSMWTFELWCTFESGQLSPRPQNHFDLCENFKKCAGWWDLALPYGLILSSNTAGTLYWGKNDIKLSRLFWLWLLRSPIHKRQNWKLLFGRTVATSQGQIVNFMMMITRQVIIILTED